MAVLRRGRAESMNRGRRQLRTAKLLPFLSLLVVAAALPQTGADQLNSERIEARFGNYGIEVLSSDHAVRISDLYTTDDGTGARTTRTLALVEYPSDVPEALRPAHEAILAGGSIGATFKADGWNVIKTHMYFGERAATAALERRMRLHGGPLLAVHLYRLDVQRDGRRWPYAKILEIHHPDYLRAVDVRAIYAPDGTGGEDAAAAAAMLAELATRGY